MTTEQTIYPFSGLDFLPPMHLTGDGKIQHEISGLSELTEAIKQLTIELKQLNESK